MRRIDIPEKNKYDEAFGLVHSDKAPKNKNKNDEKSTPKENSKSKIKHTPSASLPVPFLGIFITFGKRMSKFFGVEEGETLLMSHHGGTNGKIPNYLHKLTLDFSMPEISTLMIYSDVILPKIPVGDSMTNLLDIISTSNGQTFQRSNAVGLFRPLKNHVIKSISIAIFDRDGDKIFFPKDSYTALELEIRPVPIDM